MCVCASVTEEDAVRDALKGTDAAARHTGILFIIFYYFFIFTTQETRNQLITITFLF